ncbi:MAG TPA: YbaK/EbsC family protein [Gaiellaceae bacterium]|jgi:Ala-tRNA(Pro) deacylase|nr:YbaK/EbsC family protein [Gaiellaceae bacterium]
MTVRPAPPRTVIEHLEEARIPYDLIPHPRTETALAEAKALGIAARTVAKTIVLTTPDGFLRAVLPGSERLDLRKVRNILNTRDVSLASEETLTGAYPQFELGAVPPLADGSGDPVLIDRRLFETDYVLLEAGTHEQSLRLRTADLLTVTGGEVADLCLD